MFGHNEGHQAGSGRGCTRIERSQANGAIAGDQAQAAGIAAVALKSEGTELLLRIVQQHKCFVENCANVNSIPPSCSLALCLGVIGP